LAELILAVPFSVVAKYGGKSEKVEAREKSNSIFECKIMSENEYRTTLPEVWIVTGRDYDLTSCSGVA
jgi:hypothetical protein